MQYVLSSFSVTVTCTSGPSITTQPSNATIAAGGNTTFSATASDATSYQWQVDTGSGFANVANGGVYSGATTATLTITGATAAMSGYKYQLVASASGKPDATSDSATLTVANPPAITAQPSASTIFAGGNTSFSATASNATSYRWQVDNGSGFDNVANGGVYSGATTATLTITGATAAMNGYVYRVVASGLVTPAATSNSAALTVNLSSPTISLAASDTTPTLGATVTFTATLAGGASPGGTVTFKGGSTTLGSATISGTTATFATTALAVGANSITAVYGGDSNNATATSSAISVTVTAPTISISPTSVPGGTVGASYSQSLTASGGTGPYTFAVTAGALPVGLTLSSGNLLSGTPIAGGTFNFTVTATDNGGYTGSRAYSLTVGAPTISISPTTLPAGTVGTIYSQSLTASGGIAPHTFAVTAGSLPAGMSLSGAGILGGTPTVGGTFNFTVTATDASGYTGSTAYSLAVGQGSPTITLAASDTAPSLGASVTFTATLAGGASPGGTVTFKDGATTLGSATISGTTATFATDALTVGAHSITAVYGGDTNNATATSAAVTVTVGQVAPTIAVSASDTAPAYGGLVTFTATLTGGASPSGTVTFKDGATTIGTGTISGTTATFSTAALAVGAHSITAVYGGDTNNAAATSAAITVTVGQVAPTVTLAASDTAPAFGGSVTFTATLTGGASPSGTVTFKDGATTIGTGTISGTTATFSTAALAVGAHSITAVYGGDTNNAAATSAAITVTVGQVAPTVTLAASDTAPAFGGSVTFTATLTGGASPSGTVTFKDGATTIGTGTISGTTASLTTTALTAGAHSITAVYGGDTNNATATSAAVTVTVTATASFTFTPAGGALKAAMAGEDYAQAISATGGTGTLTYRLASGTLPAGLVLNVSTGELTGPLDDGATVANYSFAIEVRDGTGATGIASYTLEVTERTVSVADRLVTVPGGGTPPNINLQSGATGGPFSGAAIVFVSPASAGTASIVRGEFAQASALLPLGWYLKFIPNPAFSGTARVGFKLTSALGVSNTGTVTYALGHDPAKVAAEIDGLVHGFVQTRQNLIASTITVPGLLERRQAEMATDPVTMRMTPSEEGMTATFSTSLAQLESARDNADGLSGTASSPFNIWIDGTLMAHNREENGGRWGAFGMLNLGADYLLSEKALVGLSFHYDRMNDPTEEDAELTGNGWLAGPYASFEIGKGVFWNTSLLYGGSANDIDTGSWDGSFDTTRWMIDTAITGQWQIDESTVLTPKARAVYFDETVENYAVHNATGDEVSLEGFDEEQFRVSLGAEISRSFTLDNGSKLTPKLGVTGGFAGLDGSGMFGSLSAGMTLQTADFWMLDVSLLFGIEGDGQRSAGGRVGATRQF
ncbi:Ig-like domain repeat protein [Ciceribacter azotifigens]|uniref:Ig-like domain repeat protein n=1 Tax=Ciceribacter azotifigens TaxID=2069303 RepID=UPI003A8445AD